MSNRGDVAGMTTAAESEVSDTEVRRLAGFIRFKLENREPEDRFTEIAAGIAWLVGREFPDWQVVGDYSETRGEPLCPWRVDVVHVPTGTETILTSDSPWIVYTPPT